MRTAAFTCLRNAAFSQPFGVPGRRLPLRPGRLRVTGGRSVIKQVARCQRRRGKTHPQLQFAWPRCTLALPRSSLALPLRSEYYPLETRTMHRNVHTVDICITVVACVIPRMPSQRTVAVQIRADGPVLPQSEEASRMVQAQQHEARGCCAW